MAYDLDITKNKTNYTTMWWLFKIKRVLKKIYRYWNWKVLKDIIYKYLRYHYSDGTTNGKGKVRMSSMEYKETHLQDIEDINKCFSNSKLLKKCINRFILQGNNSDEAIDGIIYGVVDDFLFISSGDVLKILLKHSEDYHNGVHFSDLFY